MPDRREIGPGPQAGMPPLGQAGEIEVYTQRSRARVETMAFDTVDAVSAEYLRGARRTLREVPPSLAELETRVNRTLGRATPVSELAEAVDSIVHRYVSPGIGPAEHVPSNPFDLIVPKGLLSLGMYSFERGTDRHYKSRIALRAMKEAGRPVDSMETTSRAIEDAYIQLMRGWNEYHVNLLGYLNLVDPQKRAADVAKMGQKVFRPLTEIAPYDNPDQWLVFQVLNILTSPVEDISPIARLRAVELLAYSDPDRLKAVFFDKRRPTRDVLRGDEAPVSGYKFEFAQRLQRLPRSFRQTTQELSEDINRDWEKNSKIQEILGIAGIPVGERSYNYSLIFNTLVTKYQREALHVTLLMLGGSYSHSKAAFDALVSFSKLDPITKNQIFGRKATYLHMHNPRATSTQIEEGLGIAFDEGEELAIDLDRLTNPDDLRQVARRYYSRATQLELLLVQHAAGEAERYFNSLGVVELASVDPKGYWKTLGVHPETRAELLDELIKSAYHVHVTNLHPDLATDDADEAIRNAKMKEINEAYTVLSDPTKREQYRLGQL